MRRWKVADLVDALDGLKGRNFMRGRSMYTAASCAACHQFVGEGQPVGPDLRRGGGQVQSSRFTGIHHRTEQGYFGSVSANPGGVKGRIDPDGKHFWRTGMTA